MRFAGLEQLHVTATVERIVAGALHPDGRRYLPQLVLQLADGGPDGGAGVRLAVVDRHHVSIGEDWTGRTVKLALVCALSRVERQSAPYRSGWLAVPGETRAHGDIPIAGQIVDVAVWEEQRAPTGFATVYTECVLRIGPQTIGLKTGMAADSGPPLRAGDHIVLRRSRIDLLQIAAC